MKWLAVVPLLLVGCATPEPIWEEGMEWHYVSTEGYWQNWTVIGTDTLRGYDVFVVTVSDNNPTAFSFTTSYIDQETLGGLEYVSGELQSSWDCPATRLLPLEHQSYTCTGGPAGQERIVAHLSKPNGTVVLETPAGSIEATKIELHTSSTRIAGGAPERSQGTLYYGESVKNYVRYDGIDCSSGSCNRTVYTLASYR